MKPQKQTVPIAKSTKKQFLLTNSGVIIISILGVSGLELHSSSTVPVNFFGAQSSLGGHNSRLEGTSSDLGGTASECPPVAPGLATRLLRKHRIHLCSTYKLLNILLLVEKKTLYNAEMNKL